MSKAQLKKFMVWWNDKKADLCDLIDENHISEFLSSQKSNIEERKDDFMWKVAKFKSEYSEEMLREFFSYWTEHGENDRKFRMEKEKSFDIGKRLARWSKNSKFSNKSSPKLNRQTEETANKNIEQIPLDLINQITGNG